MIPNRKLEELLSLEPVDANDEPSIEETEKLIEENKDLIQSIDDSIDKIDAALPVVKELDAADTELDELANKAVTAFEDLQSLGLNVDPRYSGTIFQTAATMLGHAITAKQAKINKKLSIIDLQLKKARLDLQKKKADAESGENITEASGVILDRNDLLKQLLDHQNTKES